MQRLLTAAVGTFVALASLFLMPAWGWFLVVAVIIDWAAFEYLRIVRPQAPRAPVAIVPVAACAIAAALSDGIAIPQIRLLLLSGPLVLSVVLGTLLLLGRTPL